MQIEKYCLSKAVPYNLSESTISVTQFMDYIVHGKTDIFKKVYEVYMGKTDEGTIGKMIHSLLKGEKGII